MWEFVFLNSQCFTPVFLHGISVLDLNWLCAVTSLF